MKMLEVLAGAMGGGWGESPRWLKIFFMTKGSLMAEIILRLPPQFPHFEISISNTFASSFAQGLATCFLTSSYNFET